MLDIIIPENNNLWDEKKQEFLNLPECHLKLEHSLVAVRKWESKWHKPFLEKKNKKKIEVLDYIRCMSLTSDPDLLSIAFMPMGVYKKIIDYIQDPMTAATFRDDLIGASKSRNEVITSETIYCWMIQLNIPVEFENWHLESLLALIKFVNIKSAPKKKMSMKDSIQYMAALNEQRKAKYKTKG